LPRLRVLLQAGAASLGQVEQVHRACLSQPVSSMIVKHHE
jgi:hypothetical protein